MTYKHNTQILSGSNSADQKSALPKQSERDFCPSNHGSSRPVFYKLYREEISNLMQSLNATETVVYLYINSLIPFGGEVDFSIRHIARELDLHPSTVSKAIKNLETKGYIQYQINRATIRRMEPRAIQNLDTEANGVSIFTVQDLDTERKNRQCLSFEGVQNLDTDLKNRHLSGAEVPKECLKNRHTERKNRHLEGGVSKNYISRGLKPAHSNGSGDIDLISNIENIDLSSSSRSLDTRAHEVQKRDERDDDETSLIFFEESGEITQGFRSWLEKKAATLPVAPSYPEAWIRSQALKEPVQRDYLAELVKYQEREGRLTAPLGGPALDTFPAPRTTDSANTTNQVMGFQVPPVAPQPASLAPLAPPASYAPIVDGPDLTPEAIAGRIKGAIACNRMVSEQMMVLAREVGVSVEAIVRDAIEDRSANRQPIGGPLTALADRLGISVPSDQNQAASEPISQGVPIDIRGAIAGIGSSIRGQSQAQNVGLTTFTDDDDEVDF